jgi:hypothetical protein
MKSIALTLVTTFAIIGCPHWCADEIKQELVAPGDKHRARVIERNCGAMTHFVTVVELDENSLLFSRTQEVFHAFNTHQLRLEWQRENLLRIECRDCSRAEIRDKLPSALGVDIEFTLPKEKDLLGSDHAEGSSKSGH